MWKGKGVRDCKGPSQEPVHEGQKRVPMHRLAGFGMSVLIAVMVVYCSGS